MSAINEKLQRHVGQRGTLALQLTLLLGTVVICGFVGHSAGVSMKPPVVDRTTAATTYTTTTTEATTSTTTTATTTTWASSEQSILVLNSQEKKSYDRTHPQGGQWIYNQTIETDIFTINMNDNKQRLPGFTLPTELLENIKEVAPGSTEDEYHVRDFNENSVTALSYCSFVLENELYVLGQSSNFNHEHLDLQISRVNDDTCTFDKVGTLPFNGFHVICTATPNGIVVGFGGPTASDSDPDNQKKRSWKGVSPLTLDTELPQTTNRHYHGAIASSPTHALVIGSKDGDAGNTTELLDLTTWTWSQVEDYPFHFDGTSKSYVYDAVCVYFSDTFLLMGGTHYFGFGGKYQSTRIDGYDVLTDTWREVGKMLSTRQAPFSVRTLTNPDSIHIIGGFGSWRSSESCTATETSLTGWDLELWCDWNNVNRGYSYGNSIHSATHTIDVSNSFCMN